VTISLTAHSISTTEACVMNILVLTAHPDLSASFVNRRWFDALSEVPGITTRDLTSVGRAEMQFDPATEQALLRQADRVVLQFPFYWYSGPPVLKAWLDQVLLFGFAYGPGGDQLRGKELTLAISTGGPAQSYQTGSYNNFSMPELLAPFQQTAQMIGMTYLPPFVLHGAMSRDPAAFNASIPALISHVTNPQKSMTTDATQVFATARAS